LSQGQDFQKQGLTPFLPLQFTENLIQQQSSYQESPVFFPRPQSAFEQQAFVERTPLYQQTNFHNQAWNQGVSRNSMPMQKLNPQS